MNDEQLNMDIRLFDQQWGKVFPRGNQSSDNQVSDSGKVSSQSNSGSPEILHPS